jgi:hypothetical protein
VPIPAFAPLALPAVVRMPLSKFASDTNSGGIEHEENSFCCCGFMTAWVPAHAAPCLLVTLTGTQGGPPAFKGLAGPGTLVRYGDDSDSCSAMKLQFDTGRGTVMRLAELDIAPEQLNHSR